MLPTERNSCKLSDHDESDDCIITKYWFYEIRSLDFPTIGNFIFIYETSSLITYG